MTGSAKKLKVRDQYLRRTYGISLLDYELKLAAQHHSCQICGTHKSKFKRALHVDHNHSTGRVRGLLCFRCNKLKVGRLTIDDALAVYLYLAIHGEVTSFEKSKLPRS